MAVDIENADGSGMVQAPMVAESPQAPAATTAAADCPAAAAAVAAAATDSSAAAEGLIVNVVPDGQVKLLSAAFLRALGQIRGDEGCGV